MTQKLLSLKLAQWPEQDRAAWMSLFNGGGLFDEPARGANWSAGTRRKFEQSYGHWLGYLERSELLDCSRVPAERFTPQAVKAFYDDTRLRVSTISKSSQLIDLYIIARAFDPHSNWTWFKQITGRLRCQPEHWQLKPRPGISSDEVYSWAIGEIAAAGEMIDDLSWQRPLRFRDGLMVGLLIARPLRLRSFIGITMDRHLIPRGGGYLLQFEPADMKDRKAREFSIPDELVEPMHRYVAEFRPRLLAGKKTSALWASRRGTALSYDGFQQHLCDITFRAFGQVLSPHAFRHVASTSIAEEDPVHVNIIASLLGHATLTMSEKHYNRANGVKAASAYQKLIESKRRDATRKARIRKELDECRLGDSHSDENMEE